MARRHEFMVARVDAALSAAGYPKQQIPELRHLSLQDLPPSPKRRDTTHLCRCMAELAALRRRYVEGALYLVGACAFRYRGLGVDMVDLVQEGNASLFQAIDGFDWRRDVRFKTYAQYWIQQAVLKTLYNSSRTVRIPIWVQKTLRKINRLKEHGHPVTGGEMNNAAIAKALDMPEKRVDELLSTRRYAVSLDAKMPGEAGVTLATLLADDDQLPVHETITEGRLMALAMHLAGRHVQRREQRRGSVPNVVVCAAFGLPGTHRQQRLRALQRLNLRFFVDAQDNGMLRRIQMQPDDVTHLVDEERIFGELERLAAMRLKAEGAPDAHHRTLRQAFGLRQAARAPVRGVLGRRLQRTRHRRLHLSVADLPRRPGPRFVAQAVQPPPPETFAPLANRLQGHALPRRHLRVG